MNARIISDYRRLEDCPKLVQFSVVFTNIYGKKEEFIFFGFSLTSCVIKCTAFINFMFQIQGMNYVYIFPINSTLSFRNVYSRGNGMSGKYKLIQCERDSQLTLDQVRALCLSS